MFDMVLNTPLRMLLAYLFLLGNYFPGRLEIPRKDSALEHWNIAQKMKLSINGFFSKCDQIRCFLRIWSHLLNKSFMEILIFCAMTEALQSHLKVYMIKQLKSN